MLGKGLSLFPSVRSPHHLHLGLPRVPEWTFCHLKIMYFVPFCHIPTSSVNYFFFLAMNYFNCQSDIALDRVLWRSGEKTFAPIIKNYFYLSCLHTLSMLFTFFIYLALTTDNTLWSSHFWYDFKPCNETKSCLMRHTFCPMRQANVLVSWGKM